MTATMTSPPKAATVKPSKTTGLEFKVRDLSLADWGRKEILLAEQEMPGLMSVRAEYAAAKPLAGLNIIGSLHMTIQTGRADRNAHGVWVPTSAGARATSSARRTTPPPPSRSAQTARPSRARPASRCSPGKVRSLAKNIGGVPNAPSTLANGKGPGPDRR